MKNRKKKPVGGKSFHAVAAYGRSIPIFLCQNKLNALRQGRGEEAVNWPQIRLKGLEYDELRHQCVESDK